MLFRSVLAVLLELPRRLVERRQGSGGCTGVSHVGVDDVGLGGVRDFIGRGRRGLALLARSQRDQGDGKGQQAHRSSPLRLVRGRMVNINQARPRIHFAGRTS